MEHGSSARAPHDLRRIFDSLMDPLVVLTAVRDGSGRIVDFEYTDANHAACEYNGMSREELVGTRLLELLPGHIPSGLFERYARVVTTGDPLVLDDYEYPVEVRPEGDARHFDIRAVPVGDDLVYTWRDVTDRLAEKIALRDARRQRDAAWMSMDRASIGVAMSDPVGVLTYANPAMHDFLGYPEGKLVGRSFLELLHPDERRLAVEVRAELSAGDRESFHTRTRYLTYSGGSVWADLWLSPMATTEPDDGGEGSGASQGRGMVAQVVDASAEVEAQQALQRSVRHFRLLAENASDVVYQTDLEGRIEWISPSVGEVLGWDPDLLVGTRATSLVAPEDLALIVGSSGGVIRGVREHGVLAQFLTIRGSRKWMSVSAKPLVGADDDVIGAVVSLRDVTSEQTAYEELAKVQQRFRSAMDAAPQGMAITDDSGLVLDVNPAAARLLGLDQRDMVGNPLVDVLTAVAGECRPDERHEHVRTTEEGQVWIDHTSRVIPPEGGGAGLIVHQFIDETADRMWQRELQHRATHDVLTGVANRGSLLEHLREVIQTQRAAADAGAATEDVGLLFCDLDNLKELNDSQGHIAGDAVLATVAARLARSLRRLDRVGRIGGDEFVVVLDGVSSKDEVMAIAEKLRMSVERPIEWGSGRLVSTSISVGATMIGPADDPEFSLARADRALYEAKHAGRNRVVFVSDDGDA